MPETPEESPKRPLALESRFRKQACSVRRGGRVPLAKASCEEGAFGRREVAVVRKPFSRGEDDPRREIGDGRPELGRNLGPRSSGEEEQLHCVRANVVEGRAQVT